MASTSKNFSLFVVVILAVSSLIVINPAYAQSIPKPTVPHFTVTYVSGPITVSLEPFTGINGTAVFERGAVELSIENQQYGYSNGSNFSLYYNVRVRNPADENSVWQLLFRTIKLFPHDGNFNINNYGNYTADYISGVNVDNPVLPQSNTNQTTIYLPIKGSNAAYVIPYLDAWENPANSQMEIQVDTLLGVNSTYYTPDNSIINAGGKYYPAVAYVTSSDWSSTQTITISDNSTAANPDTSATPNQSVSPSQNPTATPSQPVAGTSLLFGWSSAEIVIAVLLGVVAVLLVFVVVYLRRRTVG